MTELSSKNITPDSITGMIFVMEGIRGAVVLLNGPMGCKFYHSTTSQFLTIRPTLYLPAREGEDPVPVNYDYLDNWFFRQPRVPSTWLDGEDYVYGTLQKVEEGLRYLKTHLQFDLLAIVNSPGASLIGDRLKELVKQVIPERPCVVLESPGYSRDFAVGYEEGVRALLSQIPLGKNRADRKDRPGRVNLLGLSIWNRYFPGDKQELIRLLSLCGIEVNCCLCADCTIEEIQNISQADLNLVLSPEMGLLTARYLQETCDMPYLVCEGLPIGFAATERMLGDVCKRLKKDAAPVYEESERARAFCWTKINEIYQEYGLPDGALYAVEGSVSQVYGYARFLTEYLGMIPDSLSVTGEGPGFVREALGAFLAENKAASSLDREMMDTRAELVLSDANLIGALQTTEKVFTGIEISYPGMGYTDLVPKTHLGISGALFLTEQVLNGLMSRL